MGGTLKHNTKQKQEGQYDTMEKSPASVMKLLNWCGIGSGCRGPSIKKGLTNVYILLNTFGNGRAQPLGKWCEETAPVVKL